VNMIDEGKKTMSGTNTIAMLEDVHDMYAVGSVIGSMHGHALRAQFPNGAAFECEPVSIIEIEHDQAMAMALAIGTSYRELVRQNKQGRVVAIDDRRAVVLYFYDSAFFLTTLKG